MANRSVRASFNSQQLQLLERSAAEGAAGDGVTAIRRALRECNADPVRVQAKAAAASDLPGPDTTRTLRLEHFMQPGTANIKADRSLVRDPNYAPEFTNVPLSETTLEVLLDDAELACWPRPVSIGTRAPTMLPCATWC